MRWIIALFSFIILSIGALAQNIAPGNTFIGNTNGNPPAASIGGEASWFLDVGSGKVFGPKEFHVWPATPAATSSNVFSGYMKPAFGANAFGESLSAYGKNALANTDPADANSYLVFAAGYNAMAGNINGRRTVAVGPYALFSATTTDASVAVGSQAFQNCTGIECGIAIGNQAGYNVTTSLANILVGNTAGLNLLTGGGLNVTMGHHTIEDATTAGGNVAIGYVTGRDITTATFNTLLGHGTGRGLTTGSKNTILGAQVTGLSATLANSIILADGDGAIKADFNKTTATAWSLIGIPGSGLATAGMIGEVISSEILVGSAVAIPSATVTNITSISVTAGNWDCWATGVTAPAGGWISADFVLSIHTANNSLGTAGEGYTRLPFPAAANVPISTTVRKELHLAATTTYYMNMYGVSAAGTNAGYGKLACRRVY